jgi:RNA polymerase sigma-70 factor, ECF subfamily
MEVNQEDNNLVEKFLAGEDAALESLLKKYLKPIYNFLHQLVRDSSVLDDLTQETFIKIWKNITRFDPEKNFKVWAFTIAKNTAFDYCKKKKTIPFANFTNEAGENFLENISDESILPNEILERKDLAQELDKKLKELPESYRIILNLRYKEDFFLQEIAEILGKPYNTIRSNHQRALKKLRERFI